MKKAVVLLLFTSFSHTCAIAQNRQQLLKNIISDANLPGLQLTYTTNGKTFNYAVGTGKDGSSKTITPGTIFRAGSLGKCVFAYAVMKLYDRGIIALDTPLLNYIGDYKRFDSKNPGFKKITARMVLSHTSGLTELEPAEEIKADLLFEPGSSFAYSGEGIWFLQKVVEKLLNKPFEQIMQEEVFKPLKMSHSTYVQNNLMDDDMLGKAQKGFAWLSPNAAFTLFTTANDYARFLAALLADNGLKPATWQLMFTQQSDAQRFKKPTTAVDQYIGWGLGIGLQENEKGRAIWQWGNYSDDFYSFFIAYPDSKESLVFFTRGQSALKITDQIVNTFLGKQHLWAMRWLNIGYDNPETMTRLYDLLRKTNWRNTAKVFNHLKNDGYQFSETDINGYGYALLKQKKYGRAIAIFKQATTQYPTNSNAYDSYAEAWTAIGNNKKAIANYEKALKLDTANKNAAYHLVALKTKAALSNTETEAIAGRFAQADRNDIFIQVKYRENNLTLTDKDGGVLKLFYVGNMEFYNSELQLHFKFIKDENGHINKAIMNNVVIWNRMY